MSTAKVIELIGEGATVEDAVAACVAQASKTVNGITGVYVKNIQAEVADGKISHYRVNTKLTFVVKS